MTDSRLSGVVRALGRTAGTALPRSVVALLRRERDGLRAIASLVRGRKDVPAGATAIPCGSAQKTFLVVMMVLGPVELVLVDLLVPWPWLRVVLLVLAVYSTVWMLAFYAGVHTRPHYVDDDRLVVRLGHLVSVSVDVGSVRAVRRENHDRYTGAEYRGLVTVTDDFVAVPGMSGTTVTVVLEPATPVTVQGRGTVRVAGIRFDADALDAAVTAIGERVREGGEQCRES
ncbi:hypothetical protein AB0I60_01240 [Actinosynnema sp. NPDC050436]|uniref:hypothetical protein n=1 Tax=Actinosynnema sp. NPDC050436 TaxID=3155659 RepID=UPI0033ED0479